MKFKLRRLHVKSVGKLIPGACCPRCGGGADGGTGLGTEANPVPEEGDIALCLYCGSFNRYLADLTQREMTVEELRALASDPELAELAETAARFALKWRQKNL
jgi:hypothetical protein